MIQQTPYCVLKGIDHIEVILPSSGAFLGSPKLKHILYLAEEGLIPFLMPTSYLLLVSKSF